MHTLAHHPALAMATLNLGKYFMLNSHLSARQIKLVILRVAHRFGSTYQWAHNSLGALQIGVREEEIEAVRTGPSDPVWSPDDAALLAAVDATCNGGRMDDATWSDLTARFGERCVLDLVHATGYFTMVAWGLIAADVQLEPDFAQFSSNRAKSD